MRATPEEKKQRLLAGLAEAREEVLSAARELAPAERDTVFLGTWSAHDIVAHLAGWDEANREAVEAIRGGRLPAFYARYDRDWRTFNAELVARHKQATFEETAARAEATHRALRATASGIPGAELLHDYGVRSPGNRRVTIPMLLEVEARDERRHAEQIRAIGAGEGR